MNDLLKLKFNFEIDLLLILSMVLISWLFFTFTPVKVISFFDRIFGNEKKAKVFLTLIFSSLIAIPALILRSKGKIAGNEELILGIFCNYALATSCYELVLKYIFDFFTSKFKSNGESQNPQKPL